LLSDDGDAAGGGKGKGSKKTHLSFSLFFGWGKIKMQGRNIRLKTEAGAAAAPVAEALPRRGESFACGERETKRGAGERVLQKASIVEQRTKTKAQP
jgi:hypothetical protein